MTKLTRSLIPRQLSQRQLRLHFNWVKAEWDSTSTESTRNDKIFVNVGVFRVDSVDMKSHSALTQLTLSLIPRWLSWQRVWLCIDSVWRRWIKSKQAYRTSSGALKETGFRKLTMKCSWGQCQPENVKSFYIVRSKKLTLRWLNQRRVTNNSKISANSILYSKRI